jgi:hypothetical protein
MHQQAWKESFEYSSMLAQRHVELGPDEAGSPRGE